MVQRGSLRERRTKRSPQGWIYAAKGMMFLLILTFLVISIVHMFTGEGNPFRRYSRPFMLLLFLSTWWKDVYRILFKISWKGTIRLEEIGKLDTLPLKNGLETAAILHLKGGRERRYIFRNGEGELPRFAEFVARSTEAGREAKLTSPG